MEPSAGLFIMDFFEASSTTDNLIFRIDQNKSAAFRSHFLLSLQHLVVCFLFRFGRGKWGHFKNGIQSKML
jgi:hypothetical protein